jgi:tRNA pseudouridine55 synthase
MLGWLVVDKPAGPTAHDMVARARRRLKFKRIGHSGTLDPPATGVMVLALGHATRLMRFLPGEKVYTGTVHFGMTTDTLDATGTVLETQPVEFDLPHLAAGMTRFVGEIEQQAPMVSAVHHEGRRLYELARAGQVVADRPKRTVTIRRFDRLSWDPPRLAFRVACSAGTYVRTIADDLGRLLGCGAHLETLRREMANGLTLAEAIDLETIADEALIQAILPIDLPLQHLPAVQLEAADAKRFRHGNPVMVVAPPGDVRVYDGPELIAIAHSDGQMLKAEVVLVAS